jgi:hypothetical protein
VFVAAIGGYVDRAWRSILVIFFLTLSACFCEPGEARRAAAVFRARPRADPQSRIGTKMPDTDILKDAEP